MSEIPFLHIQDKAAELQRCWQKISSKLCRFRERSSRNCKVFKTSVTKRVGKYSLSIGQIHI